MENYVHCVCPVHRSVTGHPVCCPSLLPSRVDAGLASNELETQLRALTEHHRQVCVCVCVCMCVCVCVCLLSACCQCDISHCRSLV